MENNDNLGKLNQKLIKRKILELAGTKRELEAEKIKNLEILKETIKHKLETDLLRIGDVIKEYGLSRKTIDRMRSKTKGLKYSQNSPKSAVWIVRKDLEDFLKRDRHAR
ncbi:MAG: hypothetical protein GZ087_06550 [Flavobacterium sp.]|nr:hypothetical protein [Flavobacterium sp.]